MGRHIGRARSDLRGKRQFRATFGARHPIVYDQEVRTFFNSLDERWGEILKEREEWEADATGMPRRRFALYENPEKIGLSIVERRLSEQHARRYRVRWSLNDVGRIRGEIEDELNRQGLSQAKLALCLTSALRFGDSGRSGGKFGLVAEASDHVSNLLAEEHRIVMEGLGGTLRNFQYPYDDYVPHMTIGRVYRDASTEQLNKCGEALSALIHEQPLTVTLGPIGFIAHQEL